ncbi:MAG: hypothetical protein ACXADB_08045 [Candidatus Hermodarchaeia archaeon]
MKSIADENRRLKEQVTTTERAFNAMVDKLIARIERLEHERDDLIKLPVKTAFSTQQPANFISCHLLTAITDEFQCPMRCVPAVIHDTSTPTSSGDGTSNGRRGTYRGLRRAWDCAYSATARNSSGRAQNN